MTTLKRHHAAGMPPEAYDQLIAAVAESQMGADGFVAHYGVVDGDGITVIEIWDSQAQHDKWFERERKAASASGHSRAGVLGDSRQPHEIAAAGHGGDELSGD